MADFEAAIMYVEQHGNEMERASLDHVLTGLQAHGPAILPLQQKQCSDGSWSPFWAQGMSSLDATCFHLAKAEQLGLRESHPMVHLAVQFIASRQNDDGSWEEDSELAECAPPWAKPGDLTAKLYITSNCAYWLSQFCEACGTEQAAQFLRKHVGDDGRMPTYLNAHWLTCGVLFRQGCCAETDRLVQYLSSRLHELTASDLAWLMNSLISSGFSPEDGLLDKAANLLNQKQLKTGKWASDDDPGQDVHATLQAIRALLSCGRFDEHLFFA